MKKFSEFHRVLEKDEHKKSAEYKKLTPKMKKAVDDVFTTLESNPSNFMTSFEKTVKKIAKNFLSVILLIFEAIFAPMFAVKILDIEIKNTIIIAVP